MHRSYAVDGYDNEKAAIAGRSGTGMDEAIAVREQLPASAPYGIFDRCGE